MTPKLKKIIAREGLILLIITIVLYISSFFIVISPAPPKFEAEFTNGETLTFYVTPKYDFSRKDSKYDIEYIKKWYYPKPEEIFKELNVSAKEKNITSELINIRCVNSGQLYIHSLYTYFLSYNFIIKVLILYILISIIRFIIWAIKTLKEK